ncbi:hypothetical protein NCC49_000543 [Naganishia albida]|nr:hypothetical protein NCC49_000543 [Naganishia albida]
MSSQNAGTNSPKNEQANPLGSSSVEGKTSQGVSGEQQRSGEGSTDQKKETGPSASAISAAADSASKIADPTSARHEQ